MKLVSRNRQENDIVTFELAEGHENLTNYNFFVPCGSMYSVDVPSIAYGCKGIVVQGKLIRSLLKTHNLFLMYKTNAEAIVANFFWFPKKTTLSRLFETIAKPIVIKVATDFISPSKLPQFSKELAAFGAAGICLGPHIGRPTIEKIKQGSDINIFVETGSIRHFNTLKHLEIYGISLPAKRTSFQLIAKHQQQPANTFLLANIKSVNDAKMLTSFNGINAIVFEPQCPNFIY